MTLRYEGRQPVGLDWATCTDGTPRPEVWKAATAPPPPKLDEPETPAAPKVDRVSKQRTARAVELVVVRMYRDEQKSSKVVADACGIQPATVFKILKRRGVTPRTRSEGMALSRANRG